jgi:hypothetical protein
MFNFILSFFKVKKAVFLVKVKNKGEMETFTPKVNYQGMFNLEESEKYLTNYINENMPDADIVSIEFKHVE